MSQRYRVTAGEAAWTNPKTITYTADISTATVKTSLTLLNATTPGAWTTATEDASGDVKKRVVKRKIDNTVTAGDYWFRAQVATGTETREFDLAIIHVI